MEANEALLRPSMARKRPLGLEPSPCKGTPIWQLAERVRRVSLIWEGRGAKTSSRGPKSRLVQSSHFQAPLAFCRWQTARSFCVLRQDRGEGLEAQAHPRPKPTVLEERVLVAEELGPMLVRPHLLRRGTLEEPVGPSLLASCAGRLLVRAPCGQEGLG